MNRLDNVAVFVAVVETGGISRAARRLKVSPSVVSRRLVNLEHELKTDLVVRSTRSLSTTERGQIFYEHCREALEAISEATQQLEIGRSSLAGSLHVHSTLGMGQRFIAVAIAEFLKRNPEIKVDLSVGTNDRDLIADKYDVEIKNAKTWMIPEDQCVIISPIRYMVCASPEYLEQNGRPVRPYDLASHNCLLHTHDKPSRDWRFRVGTEEMHVTVSGSLITSSGSVLYDAAKQGLGIVRLPNFAIQDDVAAGNLVVLFDSVIGMDRTLAAQIAPHKHEQPKIAAFIDFIRHYVGSRLGAFPNRS